MRQAAECPLDDIDSSMRRVRQVTVERPTVRYGMHDEAKLVRLLVRLIYFDGVVVVLDNLDRIDLRAQGSQHRFSGLTPSEHYLLREEGMIPVVLDFLNHSKAARPKVFHVAVAEVLMRLKMLNG
jgi:hypothetical protein